MKRDININGFDESGKAKESTINENGFNAQGIYEEKDSNNTIDSEELYNEFLASGEKSYEKYLDKKYKIAKDEGNEKLAECIDKELAKLDEYEQMWYENVIEEAKSDEEERKKAEEVYDSFYDDDSENFAIKDEKKQDNIEADKNVNLNDKTVEELESIINQNQGKIIENDKEIKDKLIQKILEQQKTISEQEKEIERLNAQKER